MPPCFKENLGPELMLMTQDAERAIKYLDKSVLKGRVVIVEKVSLVSVTALLPLQHNARSPPPSSGPSWLTLNDTHPQKLPPSWACHHLHLSHPQIIPTCT